MRTAVVLLSVPAPDGATRFVDQVVAAEGPEVHFLFFSWRRLLTSTFDVFHVHWPEHILRSHRFGRHALKGLLLLLVLESFRLRGIKVVRTMHNLEPHDGSSAWERYVMGRLDRATDAFIVLNPDTGVPTSAPVHLIRHGDYRTKFAGLPRRARVAGRLAFCGLIRPYKNVTGLVEAFEALPAGSASLHVVGGVSGAYGRLVAGLVEHTPGVTGTLRFVSDEVLVEEVTSAELVVLPYTEMHNSGMVLVALSLERPVLVPSTSANMALRDEVGHEWVHTYTGPLSTRHLRSALAAVSSSPIAGPALSGRDWSTVAEKHRAVYTQLADSE